MKRLLVALVVVAAVAGAPATVAAQDDGGVLDGFLDDEADDADWSAAAMGVLDKASWWASHIDPLSDAEEDRQKALEDRASLQQAFNSQNESIQNYTNSRFSVNESAWNVIAIEHVRGEASVTQFLVADVENGSFANARMVNSTDRPVDRTVTLSGYASDNAHTELDTFVEEFVAEDRDVTRAYTTRLATEYSGYVELPEGFTNDSA